MVDRMFNLASAPSSPPDEAAATPAPSNHAAKLGVSPIFPDFEQRSYSFEAAMDVLGGRFAGIKKALSHQDHRRASPELTRNLFEELKDQPAAVEMAKQRERQRKEAYLQALVAGDGPCCRQDLAWLENRFDHLMERADSTALEMSCDEQMTWRWTFELAPREDRRYFAYKFQFSVYSDMVESREGGAQRLAGGAQLLEVSRRIFSDCAYCTKHIKTMVAKGIAEPEPVGAPRSMPREVESVLFRLAAKLRSHRLPVYKSLLIYHAKAAIAGTRAALNFARIGADGEYLLSEDNELSWDDVKWDNWVYRRFIGDRRAVRMLLILEPPLQPPCGRAGAASVCTNSHHTSVPPAHA